MSKSDQQYISASKVQQQFGVSSSSLRRWDGDGKVKTIRTPGGFRLYRVHDIQQLFSQDNSTETESQKAKICYARVSSEHQKQDLERQVKDLQEKYPNYEIIKDIGSGLNYKRKGFCSILERVHQGAISEVVVAHKDRLCRYGFELVEFIFKKAGAKIVVLGQNSAEEQDSTRELADDLLAICNYFVAKNNGMRSAENKRKRRQQQQEEETKGEQEKSGKETSRKGKKNKTFSESETEGNTDEMVRDSEVDL